MFIDKIVNAPNKILLDVEYLKNSDLPLVLYGAGICAKRLYNLLLKKSDVKIKHVAIDEDYFLPKVYFDIYPVERINDVINRYPEINVIVAMDNYQNKITKISQNQNILRYIIFDLASVEFEFADYYNVVKEHSVELEKFYSKLADEHSRNVMIAYINAKISGNPEALVNLNVDGEQMYYPEFLHLSDNEVFVDCGAFDGDSVISFIKKTEGKYSKIYAFEPDKHNIEKLKKNTSQFNNIEIIEKGCFSGKATMYFQDGQELSSSVSNQGNVSINVDAVDNIISGKVTFIKMDIEGSELEALKGAQNIIRSNHPSLAISLYHRSDDLFYIPQYIYELSNTYKFFLRHYGGFSYELILYAIPDK